MGCGGKAKTALFCETFPLPSQTRAREAYCVQIECFECNRSDPNVAKDRDWQVFHGVQPQELSEDKERALAERLKREGHPGWPYQCY